MDGIRIGYARASTTDQDLTARHDALLRLGVEDAHIYVDHGMTGANHSRPGLREAPAAVRGGDTLVVTKRERLTLTPRDAREIADVLMLKGVALSLGGNRWDPAFRPNGADRPDFPRSPAGGLSSPGLRCRWFAGAGLSWRDG